jgi:O-methyltransferase
MSQTHADLLLLDRVHEGVDIELHSRILLEGLQVAGRPFLPMYRECLEATRTLPKSWKVFRRAQRAYNFARYVEHVASLGGPMVECGVFNGFSALLACRILAALRPGFRGEDLFLVDSFEGLSAPKEEDLMEVTHAGRSARVPSHGQGHFAVGLPVVRARFGDYPEATFVKGWIPPALQALPERRWSFVHIDVDLYEPTLACLEYFHGRMAPGGVILNDDFSSPLFPGGNRAWLEFFERHPAPFLVLDTGQAIYVKP